MTHSPSHSGRPVTWVHGDTHILALFCPCHCLESMAPSLRVLLGNLDWEWPDFCLCPDLEIVHYSESETC